MFRISLGLYYRSLLFPKSNLFGLSLTQNSAKSIISEIPEEHLNTEISFSKEFPEVVNRKNHYNRNIVPETCCYASQGMPLATFSPELHPRLLEDNACQGKNKVFSPPSVPEVTEDCLQQDAMVADCQHSQNSSSYGNSEDNESNPTLLKMFSENEDAESLNQLDQSKIILSPSVIYHSSHETKRASSNPMLQNHFAFKGIENEAQYSAAEKKNKVKHKLKSDRGNEPTKKKTVLTISQRKGKEKLTDVNSVLEATVKNSVPSITASEKKANQKMHVNESWSNSSDSQYNESTTDALNKRHMQTLKSYINVCVSTNMTAKAHKAFLTYRSKKSPKFSITDVEVYDALLSGWARKGHLKVIKSLFSCMKSDGFSPTLQSYASYLECLARNNMHHHPEVRWILSSLEQTGYCLEDLFIKCKFADDQIEKIIDIISCVKPEVLTSLKATVSSEYSCKLLRKLNNRNYKSSQARQAQNSFLSRELLSELATSQMEVESQCTVEIRLVNATENVGEKVRLRREQVKKYEDMWQKSLSQELKKTLHNYQNKLKIEKKCLSLYPYLTSVDSKILVDIMLKEIRFLAENCESFSPNVKVLYHNMGKKVMNHYFVCLKKNNKINDKILSIYNKYAEYLVSCQLSSKYLPRVYWELLKLQEFKGPTIDAGDVSWSFSVLNEIGKFLYKVIFDGVGFNFKLHKVKSSKECLMPVFCILPVNAGTRLTHQVRVHPHVSQLYREAELENMFFDVSLLPMVCPPRPWSHVNAGGLLITPLPFIRLPSFAPQTDHIYNKTPSRQLFPCFDSLNKLSLCPWIINKPMLDLVIEVFKNNGCEELDVPINPKCFSLHCDVKKNQHKKSGAVKEQLKKKAEMTGLWQDCLYKLTIANAFRDKVFWFPHNLDFRGRVYPTPPHFNHLGSDMVRSILLFAEAKLLGENGLNWLKIHLINLTGLKKREPLSERLKFANLMMPEILDSADKPFTGNLWWKTSDEPWQTLACCKEIASAVRSPDPSKYISHFPVHQDGSCNGLQHYAALGRDEFGAREVNLHPADAPRDVYSSVAALVEKERSKDAACGSEIAQALEGFIQRKVVKQTVMTYVYGVTLFGAKLQILKQLKDNPSFPERHYKEAVKYISAKIFLSIEEMFTATQQIQNWFTNCAELITKVLGKPVEWVTPVGLPVIQPYHRKVSIRGSSSLVLLTKDSPTAYKSSFEASQQPNVMKQKNAFAPNFIHSLDSSHMMLTALFCHHEGITFVSVHDCFWTHPCTVEIMNRICREQFVALHNEPILEQLSEYFVKQYLEERHQGRLQTVLTKVPERGNFKLEKVLDSVYFFS